MSEKDFAPGDAITLSDAIIQFRDVSKSFDGGKTFAVRDISLDVKARSLMALVGQSGAGKTTLMKAINRLVEVEGELVVEGRAVRTSDVVALRRRIGYAFQGVGLFPHMSVAENIAITPRLLGWDEPRIAARVVELLRLVNLPTELGVRAPDALSGGQRQRVGLARALAAGPSIMLMDEPFGALDPVTRDGLATAYRALHDKLGLTTIIVTHDVQEAVLMADRIVVMGQGRVLADGTPAALMAGHGDPNVAAMMEMPRRRAERVQALLGEPTS